jgi:hypothetical protein
LANCLVRFPLFELFLFDAITERYEVSEKDGDCKEMETGRKKEMAKEEEGRGESG